MENWRDTLASQYATSPTLVQLLSNFNAYLDPRVNIDAFFDNMLNIETAVGYGLDCWGRIVGVSRLLDVAAGAYLGFEEAGTPATMTPFNTAPFYSGAPLTSVYALSDTAYRMLILAKGLFNITDGSIPAINRILRLLFPGRGACYVADNLDMSLEYTFEFALTAVEQAIVEQSGVLPRPTGVSATVVII